MRLNNNIGFDDLRDRGQCQDGKLGKLFFNFRAHHNRGDRLRIA
ncbi:hypothetical protein [Spirulina sp. 06S082]|nr:hypothetical protein [Spirulina sp. 06S082]MEA5471953.1 hypothetical protein [Spirulina sp. 06S082]